MRHVFLVCLLVATFCSCNKSNPSNDTNLGSSDVNIGPIPAGTTGSLGFDYTSYDDWLSNTSNAGFWNGQNKYFERVSWTYSMPSTNVVARFAQNISGRAKAPQGWQRIDANKASATNNYMYMRIRSYNPGLGCLPYPKIQLAMVHPYDSIVKLQATADVGLPTAATNVSITHNSAFDIYFDKVGTLSDSGGNYLAMMIWLNKQGSMGPAGERLSWKNGSQIENTVLIDGISYYLVGRMNFTNNNYIINFVMSNPTNVVNNINILNLMRFICNQKSNGRLFYFTDGQGPKQMQVNLSGAKLSDFNFGFEIFKSVNDNYSSRSQKALTFTIKKFAADFVKM